jgi:ribonuclease HI
VFGDSSPYLCEILAALEALRRVKEGIKNVYLLTDCQDLVNFMEGIDTSKLYGNQFRGGRGGAPSRRGQKRSWWSSEKCRKNLISSCGRGSKVISIRMLTPIMITVGMR